MEVRLVIVGRETRVGIGQLWFAKRELVQLVGQDGKLKITYRKIDEPLTLWNGHFSKEPVPIHYYVMDGDKLSQVHDLNLLK